MILATVILLVLASPCGSGRCEVAEHSAHTGSALPFDDIPTFPVDAQPLHCGLHCGLLLLPTLLIVGAPALIVRVSPRPLAAVLHDGPCPPLPPPQAA